MLFAGGFVLATLVRPADVLQGSLLFGAGDLVAQRLDGGRSLDSARLAKATGVGTVYGGLLLPASYNLAEHCFPGRSVRAILLKASLSYTCLSLGGNYFSIGARRLLSMPPDDAGLPLPERVRRCLAGVNADSAGVLLDDVKVWPIYDVLCFSLIPAALRPKATAIVSVCWHTYISHVAARERCIAVD